MKITYNLTKIVVLTSLVIWIMIYIVFNFLTTILEWRKTNSTRKAIIQTMPADYVKVFNLKHSGMIRNVFTEISSVRPQITRFDYDSDKYCIILTKIKLDKDIALSTIIKEKHDLIGYPEDNSHFLIKEHKFDFYYLASQLSISNILLTLDGNAEKIITKKDTIASYYLMMRGFSIHYNKDNLPDLLGNAKDDPIPTCISFLKRNNYIYIILMSINYDSKLEPKLLNDLITSKI